MKSKKNVHFVSELDKFFEEFDHTHPPTESQQAEIKKHQRVIALRDGTAKDEKNVSIQGQGAELAR